MVNFSPAQYPFSYSTLTDESWVLGSLGLVTTPTKFTQLLEFVWRQEVLVRDCPGLPRSSRPLIPFLAGLASIIVTAAVLIGVKLYTTFPIVKLLDMSLPILTTSILTAIVLSVALYVKAVYQKTANHDYGKTGNVLYDIFAGAEVNPRVGPLDVKTALLRTALITTVSYSTFCCCFCFWSTKTDVN